jgi:D-arabinose 1-dehydrogenase-like Zn-dependent alcohol dehydrogenase
MRAVQVASAGSDFELIERDGPDPPRGHVLVRVRACGVCHSDAMVKGGLATSYPRVPGHEVAGVVEAVGEGVTLWTVGQRVGIGWYGGACFICDPCRRGDFISCLNGRISGLTDDGGYADFVVSPWDALAALPDVLSDEDAAPLMCAGVTTFNGLRQSGAGPGEAVAVLGLGGLGHRGVQFAAKMGFQTIAGAPAEPLNISAADLVLTSRLVAGHASGTAKDSEDTLRFAALTGVRPIVETAPLEEASTAYERMMAGNARFRIVLTTS